MLEVPAEDDDPKVPDVPLVPLDPEIPISVRVTSPNGAKGGEGVVDATTVPLQA